MFRNSLGNVMANITSSPYRALRVVMTRRSLWSTLFNRTLLVMSVLDLLQPVALDVIDQRAIGGQARQHLGGECGGLAKIALGTIGIVRAPQIFAVGGAEAHAVQHVLIARGRKHFFDTMEVVARRRMMSPQREQFS